MSTFRSMLVTFILSPLLLLPASSYGQFIQKKAAAEKANAAVPVSAPRELRINLERARKALQEKQYVDVCDHINQLLKSDTADYFVDNTPNSAGLKEEVTRLALSLTGEARRTYELRFGVEAEGALDEALKESDWNKLDWLQFRYVGTKAAAKAALISARIQMDQGEPAAAAIRLERIASIARGLEPELSLLAASGWLQAGDRSSARAALLRLHREQRPTTIKLGANDVPWFDEESQIDAWMDRWLSPSIPAASPPPTGERPKLQLAWRVTSGENSQEIDVLTALRDQFNRNGVTALPVLSPLLGGDWIVARSTQRLFGFDPKGGKRVWAYPPKPADGLNDPLTTTMHEKRKALTAAGEAVFRRTWTDGLYAGIATDGDRHLFLIEGLAAPQPKSRYGVRFAVRRKVRFPFADPNTNRLVALDLKREGALAWTTGGGEGSNEKLKKAFFISPPVINGESVLVLAEIEQQIKLFSFSSKSGDFEWEQDLLVLNNDKVANNPERRLRGGRLAVKNGMLLCWTGADYLFGYDLAARRFIWKSKLTAAGPNAGAKDGEIETYPLNPRYRVSYRNPGNEWQRFAKLANPDDRWTNASLLCAGRYCLITPPNLQTMMCIDLYTGKSIWTKPKRDFLYVACEFDDSILLAGRYRMALVGLSDGRPKWVGALQSLGSPSGHGVRVGRYYYVPTSEGELLSVDMTTGEMVSKSTEFSLGNLAKFGDLIVSQSPTSFVAFTPQDADDPPAPTTAAGDTKVENLVQRLGDVEFQVREDAEKQLRALGLTASTALEVGLKSNDPETRIRCRRLLTRVAQNSRDKLIADFKKNDPKNQVQLPGWKDFKQVVGDTKESRVFFADMYVAEFNLFDEFDKKSERLTALLQQRCTELQTAMSQFQYQLSLPTISSVIYLSTRKEVEGNATLTNYAVTFCSQNAFRQNIGAKQNGPLLKKLLVGLMNQSSATTPNYQLINLGMQYDIKECYELARRFLNNRQQSGYAKAYALSAISRYGVKERDTKLIEKTMTDTMQCSSYTFNGKRYITQVRDVALVSLIELYKQDPKKFDFPRYQKNGHSIAFHTIGFINDKDRKAAVAKWKKFQDGDDEQAAAKDGKKPEAAAGADKEGEAAKQAANKEAAKEGDVKKDDVKEGAKQNPAAKAPAAVKKKANVKAPRP